MLRKILRSGVVLMLLLSLSACTAMLWSKSGEKLTREDREGGEVIKADKLLGFVQVKAPSDHEQPQMLIVGKEYVYPLSIGRDQAQQVINSGLDIKYWRAATSDQGKDSDINLYLKDGRKDSLAFAMVISLRYEKKNLTEQEVQTLLQLGARPIDVNNQQGGKSRVYVKEIHFEGQVQGMNDQLRALNYQKFSHDYSIVMHSPSKEVTRINYAPLLRQTALTPFAVVGDIILLPFWSLLLIAR